MIAAVLVSAAGCGPPQPRYSQPQPSQPQAAIDERHCQPGRARCDGHAFSIVPPPGYQPHEPWPMQFMSYRAYGDAIYDPNFSVMSERSDGAAIDDAPRRARLRLPWVLSGYRPLEQGETTIDGKRACWLSGSFLWQGHLVRNLQYFIPGQGGAVYIVTFASLADSFARNRPLFESSAATARAD
jgi:hypothetical protein